MYQKSNIISLAMFEEINHKRSARDGIKVRLIPDPVDEIINTTRPLATGASCTFDPIIYKLIPPYKRSC